MVKDCMYDLKSFKSANITQGDAEDDKDEKVTEIFFISVSNQEMAQAVLWTKEHRKILQREASGAAVIDSGYSKNCYSQDWLEDYVYCAGLDPFITTPLQRQGKTL